MQSMLSAMNYTPRSIRAFVGAKDFAESRLFYSALGYKEIPISKDMSLIKVTDDYSFYLQDAYVKDWVNNTMIFLEVEDVDKCWKDIFDRKLTEKFKNVRLKGIVELEWGREFFLHDPSGILWHFGQFNKA